MSKPIIEVTNLSKCYTIGARESYDSLREEIMQTITAPFRRLAGFSKPQAPTPMPSDTTLWALKDVSFEVQEGDVIGIIGRNGAGKSTLLKILSRITEPTSGRIVMRGRVASLLEVGTGFHPELTGRENIFLNGSLLGMNRQEIKAKFDEIVAFAEIDKFIDTPVKRYSSGMYVRLAFAVAAHMEPEILIIDEVLAVGDAQFQKKCLGKMKEVGKEGRTVLFVSHNMQAIQTLCNKGILLANGGIDAIGNVHSVINEYLDKGLKNVTERVWNDNESAPGNEIIKIKSARIIPDTLGSGNIITVKTPFQIEFVFSIILPEALFYIGFHLRTVYGEVIFVTASVPKIIRRGVYRSTCFIPGDLLNNGTYSLEVYFVRDSNVVLYKAMDLLVFEVHDVERVQGGWLGEYPGSVRPKLRWDVETVLINLNAQGHLSIYKRGDYET